MDKNIFGSTTQRQGAKVPTQEEWNALNNALTNITVGSNNFIGSNVSGYGAQLPYDSFFFPHLGYIEENYTDAVIGIEREKDYYPYVDYIAVSTYYTKITLIFIDGKWAFRGGLNTDLQYTSVSFPTPNIIEPSKPTDPNDCAIVGYKWELIPSITNVQISGEDEGSSVMVIDMEWVPGAVFDDDDQADVYTVDAGTDPEDWVPRAYEEEVLGGRILEDFVNDWLFDDGSEFYPVEMHDGAKDYEVKNKIASVPVARYDWNVAQDRLDRCIQLLFTNATLGILGNAPSTSAYNGIPHPFKSRIKPDYPTTVEVGYLRPDWNDNITIEMPTTDHDTVIEFGATEEIELDSAEPFKDYYIYYDIFYSETTAPLGWVARLEKSESWPPTQDTVGDDGTMTGNILRQIGFAEYDSSNTTYVWYQHMFECPTERPVQPRGEFEAWYTDDGSVWVETGTVESFNDSSSITRQKFPLDTNTDIWVECKSLVSSGDPSVTISGFKTGTYPGLYQKISDDEFNFNYHIGSIDTYEYVPKHLGRLHIDNTLLMPDVVAGYTSAEDSPRIMFFHDDQVTSVGDISNDRLLYSEFVEWQIRGGGNQHITEGTELSWYGLTETGTYDPATVSGVDGTSYGTGSMTIAVESRDYEWDHGLVQTFDAVSPTTDIVIEAGANILISYAVGTATIESKGGVTQDLIPDSFDVSGVDGSTEGTGSITITAKSIDNEIDDGHVQTLDIANSTLTAQVAAGTGCSIAYAAGVATINVEAASDYVSTKNSIEWDNGSLQLVGDEANPTAWKFYGTEGTPALGYQQAEYITVITDAQLDASNNLQIKTRQCRVFDLQAESSWTTVTGWSTTSCP